MTGHRASVDPVHRTADECLSDFGRDRPVRTLTWGQFSAIDWLEALIRLADPVEEIVISTWTAANADLRRLHGWAASAADIPITWLLDGSFPTRKPESFAMLCDLWGDRVRVLDIHAKFFLVRGAGLDIVSMTSANLNRNPRIEMFDAAHDPAQADLLRGFVRRAFDLAAPGPERARGTANRKLQAAYQGGAESGMAALPLGYDVL